MQAWELTDFPRAFGVSVLVAAITVVGTILLASFTAFAIARNWDRRLFRSSFFYLLAAMFLPFPVLALSQVKLTGLAHLDNPFGVALLHVMFQLSFSVLLFTAFLRSIPAELEESARIDGASTARASFHCAVKRSPTRTQSACSSSRSSSSGSNAAGQAGGKP